MPDTGPASITTDASIMTAGSITDPDQFDDRHRLETGNGHLELGQVMLVEAAT
jgi:hypothetical protein